LDFSENILELIRPHSWVDGPKCSNRTMLILLMTLTMYNLHFSLQIRNGNSEIQQISYKVACTTASLYEVFLG
jgi:hypothetical protein